MSETIIIRTGALGEDPDTTEVHWAQADGERAAPFAAQGTLREAAEEAVGRQVVVLVPGADVLLTAAHIPAQQRRQLMRVLPFALEEQLAADVETLHFAAAPQPDDVGRTAVAVVARARMDRWLALLQEAGLWPDVLLPDVLALPWEAPGWSLMLEAHGALLRTGAAQGYAMDTQELESLLPMALEQAGDARPQYVRLWDCRGGDTAGAVVGALEGLGVEVRHAGCGESGAVSVMAASAETAVNLLQGEYSRREHLGRVWRPWRAAAVLAVLVLAVQGGMGLYNLHALRGERVQLNAQIEQAYRSAFPEARRVVNPKVQMQRGLEALRQQGGSSAFVRLLGAAGPVLRRAQGVELQGLSFRDGAMVFNLVLNDLQSLDRLKRALSDEAKLTAEIEAASSREGKVEGRLRVEGART